jgi:hypothetical protein
LRFRLVELAGGLIRGRPVRDVVLIEERRSSRDFSSSRYEYGSEESFQGGANLHVIGLGIALPLDPRRIADPRPPETSRGRQRRERHRKSDTPIHRLDLSQRECIVALSVSASTGKGKDFSGAK